MLALTDNQVFRSDNSVLTADLDISSTTALNMMEKVNDPGIPDIDLSLLYFPRNTGIGGNEDLMDWTSQTNTLNTEFGYDISEERRSDDDNDMNVELELDFGEDDTRLIENDNAIESTRSRLNSSIPSLMGNQNPQNLDREDMLLKIHDDLIHFDDNFSNASLDTQRQEDNENNQSCIPSSIAVQLATQSQKRRSIQVDVHTLIPTAQIKQQQADRSAILKPASYLPRNNMLLKLMELERSGGFVSSVIGNGQAKDWAPELRDMLSLERVRVSGALKRSSKVIVHSADEGLQPSAGRLPQSEIFGDEGGFASADEDTVDDATGVNDTESAPMIDDTTAPVEGTILLGTQHVVHTLTDQRLEGNTFSFQEVLPEAQTSKADATKMFFEVLVLAGRNAVEVDQSEGPVGSPIRIHVKKTL